MRRKYSKFRWRMEIRDEHGAQWDTFLFNTKREAQGFLDRNRKDGWTYTLFDYRKEEKEYFDRCDKRLEELEQRRRLSGGIHVV